MNYDIFKIKENIYLAPVLHGTLFFTLELRKMLNELNPDIVAIELPKWMKFTYIRAIKFLPEITIITYTGRKENENYYLVVEPTDPFVEAVRYAIKNRKKIEFIDSDAVSYYEQNDPFYENFFLEKRSWGDFFTEYKDFEFKKVREDRLREKSMAYNLKTLSKNNERIVTVIGMAHYKGLLEQMGNEVISIFSTYKPKVELKSIHPDNLSTLLSDYPYINWAYENYRANKKFKISKPKVIKKKRFKFSVVIGEQNDYEKRYKEEAQNLYVDLIQENNFFDFDIDRRLFLYKIYKKVGELYKFRYKEEFYPWQLKNIVKFSRNISILKSDKFFPDYFTILEATKGCVDDNYTWELMQILGFYSYQPESSVLPQIDINSLNNYKSMFIRKREKRATKAPLRRRKREKSKGDWKKSFNRGSICSHQPEDIIVENFADFLKRRAKRHLLSELIKSEKFTTSFFEGIDVKETIRKQDGIYVKKYEKLHGEIGSVVFIFDEDMEDTKYQYKMTWLGEHEQESDMAFYSTAIGEDIIGPGISRCEYGGFLLSYPPGRLYDVWTDDDYHFFEKKSEKLLAAAIDYSTERYVVYIAKKPPRSKIVSWAKRNDREVVYLPLGAFSKNTINKIRIFHILAGHDVRDIADDYIF